MKTLLNNLVCVTKVFLKKNKLFERTFFNITFKRVMRGQVQCDQQKDNHIVIITNVGLRQSSEQHGVSTQMPWEILTGSRQLRCVMKKMDSADRRVLRKRVLCLSIYRADEELCLDMARTKNIFVLFSTHMQKPENFHCIQTDRTQV